MRAKAFPMYGGMGVSTPSLHRESTDSLMVVLGHVSTCSCMKIPHVCSSTATVCADNVHCA